MHEQELIDKSIAYLKIEYGEDTVCMNVIRNDVLEGHGVLHVDCTVSIGGAHSDWTEWFSFRDGAVTSMRWQMR